MPFDINLGIKQAIKFSTVQFAKGKKPVTKAARVYVAGPRVSVAKLVKVFGSEHQSLIEKQKKPVLRLFAAEGPILLVRPALVHHFVGSSYAQNRDAVGTVVAVMEDGQMTEATLEFEGVDERGICGALVGLGVAQYRYLRAIGNEDPRTIFFTEKPLLASTVKEATAIASAINVARHLVNLPPNLLNPKSYADAVKKLFGQQAGCKVEVWDFKRLKQEGMGLHAAVGQGAEHPPALVCIRYRPSGTTKAGGKVKPVALVGKGITFDSGGLDLKPSAGMRLMKKDMGGSAAVVGAVLWAAQQRSKIPIDAYLALAENSVDEKAFRPSDVVTARNGLRVEIHNTDAEGRLVLADALDVATRKTEALKPQLVVNVATLTGAIKVALGADIAGLFSNDSALVKKLESAAQRSGDPVWEMPLYQKYRSQSHSNFADTVNATDGFGGAITAALFLESFVDKVPWAHLDMYAWKDSPEGCLSEAGGSGQTVQTLVEFLKEL